MILKCGTQTQINVFDFAMKIKKYIFLEINPN